MILNVSGMSSTEKNLGLIERANLARQIEGNAATIAEKIEQDQLLTRGDQAKTPEQRMSERQNLMAHIRESTPRPARKARLDE